MQTARGSACGPAVPLGRGPESGRPLDPAARPWGRGRHLSRSGEGLEEGWAAWSRAVPRARTRAVCLAWIKLPAFPLCSRPLHEAWRVLLQVEEAGAVRLASRFRSFERDAVFFPVFPCWFADGTLQPFGGRWALEGACFPSTRPREGPLFQAPACGVPAPGAMATHPPHP